MVNTENIDVRAAHVYFSKYCFNYTWELIEKEEKTENDILAMKHTAHAALYHWSQRAECTDQNLSIGYWQLSRVYALAEEGKNAVRYGEKCLQYSKMYGVAPVFLGYAYEALARGYALMKNNEKKNLYLDKTQEIAQTLQDEEREQLLGDLATIG